MEVTKDNFLELLPLIQASIESADFLAMDFEFTGLLSELDIIHEFDRLEDIYSKLRKHTQRYWACQLGLTCFSFSQAENCYVARPFNFWLFPNNSRKDLTFMPSCISFLARIGFDFNKLILHGITYDKLAAPQVETDVSSFYLNSASNAAKIEELLRTVDDFIESPQKKIELNVGSLFIRKAFIKQFDKRFRGLGCQIMKAKPTLLKISKSGKRAPAILMHEEEIKREEAAAQQHLGVEEVIKYVLLSKKPLVAHNMLYDLLFLYEQFVAELPPSYSEFKFVAKSNLPPLYDTKLIPRQIDSLQISNTGLVSLLDALDRKICINVRMDVEAGFNKYVGDCSYHEAGYDSYITGLAFAKMAHLVKNDRGADDIWSALHDCLGKVPLSGSHYNFFDLYNHEPSDSGFYENMLVIKSSLKTIELCTELRKYGDVKVIKTGPQSFIARFPRLDDTVASLADVINEVNLTQIIAASQFRI
mmetsp:Transcript_3274/g.6750  ORF Transcript_3274/g.6750 Transcript_3274/m.6750 type:complete len:475 (-) Transcript_3274:2327-3751(-)